MRRGRYRPCARGLRTAWALTPVDWAKPGRIRVLCREAALLPAALRGLRFDGLVVDDVDDVPTAAWLCLTQDVWVMVLTGSAHIIGFKRFYVGPEA